MKQVFLAMLICCWASPLYAAESTLNVIAKDLTNVESVVILPDGKTYVSIIGKPNTPGDGAIWEIKDGVAVPFVKDLNDPKGLVAFKGFLFVTDNTVVHRINLMNGKSEIWADTKDFPIAPQFLNDIAADEQGNLYVSDSGDRKKTGGAIFKISTARQPKGSRIAPPRKVTVVAESSKHAWCQCPNGLLVDSLYHLLVVDIVSGELNRLRLSDGAVEKVADGFKGGDGLCFDAFGRLYISSWGQGKMWSIPRPGEKPVLMVEGLQSAADIGYNLANNTITIPDMKAGTLQEIPAQPPGWEVNVSPLAVTTELAYDNVSWTNWDSGEDVGKVIPLRPIVLTHAGDGSNRTFVATQHGVIHILPQGDAKATKVFLDIEKKVLYKDNENEQGLLGLAFHPKYQETGEFFVFYTDKSKRLQNVISRFRVSKDDPNKADPNSEEELFRIEHNYWNHDGGTIAFGPDGFLYIVLGDGGSGNDPDDHGQDLTTHLGKILRIDVSKRGTEKPYSIPADNPFLKTPGAKPEIYAYGVRNPWRLSFDRKTGEGWFGEVGQNLWEEVNLLSAGANYGWRRRESLHPFWIEGTGPKAEYTDPIWEYSHDVGKSVCGGFVYRGSKVPELAGYYIYADYVSGKIWALKYDTKQKRVTENRVIAENGVPILSFGEDEQGEVFYMTYSASGKGLYRFVSKK